MCALPQLVPPFLMGWYLLIMHLDARVLYGHKMSNSSESYAFGNITLAGMHGVVQTASQGCTGLSLIILLMYCPQL